MTFELILYCVLVAAVSYCCGNFNGAIITSKARYHSDVRQHGSGNAGLTNFYRSYGKGLIIEVILIDMGKAIIAVMVGGIMLGSLGYETIGKYLAMFGVIAGHIFPATFDFKGGKGILSAWGALLIIDWRIMLALAVVFGIVLAISHYVSLGSLSAVVVFPVLSWFSSGGNIIILIFSLLCSALIAFMHRGNIKRLINKEEMKLKIK